MIRVLIVDDSVLVRQVLSAIVASDPSLSLVAAAADAYQAREWVKKAQPDVITLDIEMPKVNGLVFLDRLMKARPTPVLMVSSQTEAGADATLQALELGAVDVIHKPVLDSPQDYERYRLEVLGKIHQVAQARPKIAARLAPRLTGHARVGQLLALGASTGGTEALRQLLQQLPVDCPPIVIVQHMPAGFTQAFAQRLNKHCALTVTEALDGERLQAGHAYVAPGDRHLVVRGSAGEYRASLLDSERVSGHRPSVDLLFESVARAAKTQAMAAILTGMGSDGAQGIALVAEAGGYTLAQDEQSCVIFGMPKEAIKTGTVACVGSLSELGAALVEHWSQP